MPRLACVDLPAFPLQLLLEKHADWRDWPAAVVAEDKPQAPILWTNRKARHCGIRPGQRYAAALALTADLRAGVVSPSEIQKWISRLTEKLRRYSPSIEPAGEQWNSPGLFWLDAAGLSHLYPRLRIWAETIRDDLARASFQCSIAVGFSRFGSYACARSQRGVVVFEERCAEERHALQVSLAHLDIPPQAQEHFIKLRILTVDDLLRLPAKGLLKRFGPETHALHRLASGELYAPLIPQPQQQPLERTLELPWRETDSERLSFFIKQVLDGLLQDLHDKHLALTRLILVLELDDHSILEEELRPDSPTLNGPQLLGLVRLRLESLRLHAGVTEVLLKADAIRAVQEQLLLVTEKPRRDHATRNRAFARLRAEFGDGVVVSAQLTDGHLPTARFQWRPLETLSGEANAPAPDTPRCLVRRIYETPLALPPRPRHEPDGWLLRGLEYGPIRNSLGPYILSGGWWKRTVHREYYFVKMQQGDVLWVYYDCHRRRWFLQGRVE